MNNISFAGAGALVVVLESISTLFGLQLPAGSIAAALNDVVNLMGFALLVVGQLRRPDLHFGLVRKV